MLNSQVFMIHSQISQFFTSIQKNLLLFLPILFFTVSLQSQDSTDVYKWTPENRGRNIEPFLLVGGDDERVVTVFREKRKDVSVKTYDYDSMEETSYESFKLDAEFSIDENVVESFYLNGKVYFFIQQFIFKAKTQKLVVKTLNIEDKTFSQRKEIDYIEKGKNNRRGSFNVQLNNDSTHFIVIAEDPSHRKEKKTFSAKYFDTDLNLKWEKAFSLPYGSGFTYINQVKGDNNGNMHLGIEISPDKGISETALRDQSQNKFILLSYFWQQNKIKETDLNVGDKWVADMAFDVSQKDELVVSGFYSNDRFNSIAGSFYLRLNSSDLAVQAVSLNPLSKETLEQLIGEKKTNKGKEVPRMELRHIVVTENGGSAIIGEQFWMRERNEYSANGGFFTRQVFYFMDLVVVKYEPNGDLKWENVIPKRQESVNDRGLYSSIALANKGDDLYLIFNDDEKNLELINDRANNNLRNFNTTKSDPSYVRIDSAGNVKRWSPFRGKKRQYKLRPLDSIQSSKNHLVILASRNGAERFCLFELE